jgi:hypothetical protein
VDTTSGRARGPVAASTGEQNKDIWTSPLCLVCGALVLWENNMSALSTYSQGISFYEKHHSMGRKYFFSLMSFPISCNMKLFCERTFLNTAE